MTCHVIGAPYIRIRLQVEHKTNVEGVRGFVCAIDVQIFVTRQAAPACLFEGCGLRAVEILQVKNRAT